MRSLLPLRLGEKMRLCEKRFMEAKYISVQKTARYYTLGNLSKHTENIWFVCHGYGQLANYFIKNFQVLDNEKNYVIAPEGLHRFYKSGMLGRVGATWMTSEDRLNDIKDYINYLNQLYFELLQDINTENVTINILGFSQGAATICRWIADRKIRFDKLILWAGIFPPDLDFKINRDILQKAKIHLVYGDQDEFFKKETLDIYLSELKKNNITAEIIRFKGGHEITIEALRRIL